MQEVSTYCAGDEDLRRLDIDAGKELFHVVFGTAVEDPAVEVVRIGQGLKIGNGRLFRFEVVEDRSARLYFPRTICPAAGIGIHTGLERQPTEIYTLH